MGMYLCPGSHHYQERFRQDGQRPKCDLAPLEQPPLHEQLASAEVKASV